MILSDNTIKSLLKNERLVVDPIDEENQIQPASIDLKLNNSFKILKPTKFERDELEYLTFAGAEKPYTEAIRMDKSNKFEEITGHRVIIKPHSFVLASTKEWIELPNYISGAVEGRSSVGRIGLFIQNAGWIDPGFKGQITLELYNANEFPVVIEAGRRICQLVLKKTDEPVLNPYHGKYNGQKGATESRIERDEDYEDDLF
jgi:dCTP deaminase